MEEEPNNIIIVSSEDAALHRIFAHPAEKITFYKETVEAMLRFMQDYPHLADNMTININMFIMQSIDNARKQLEHPIE